jgi:hypothetical protein
MAHQAKSMYNLKNATESNSLVKVRTFPHFVPEMFISFPFYSVQIICIYLAQILQSIIFGLLSDHCMLQWQQDSNMSKT